MDAVLIDNLLWTLQLVFNILVLVGLYYILKLEG